MILNYIVLDQELYLQENNSDHNKKYCYQVHHQYLLHNNKTYDNNQSRMQSFLLN